MVLDEFLDSIADSDHVTFLYEVSVLSFEEGLGRCSVVCDHTINHRDFESFMSFDDSVLCRDNFGIDVVT